MKALQLVKECVVMDRERVEFSAMHISHLCELLYVYTYWMWLCVLSVCLGKYILITTIQNLSDIYQLVVFQNLYSMNGDFY